MDLNVFESPGKEWDEFASRYTDLISYQSVWGQVLKEGLGEQPLSFFSMRGWRDHCWFSGGGSPQVEKFLLRRSLWLLPIV